MCSSDLDRAFITFACSVAVGIYNLSYLSNFCEQALQSKLTALSNAAKLAHAAAQGASATFPGKGKFYYGYLHLSSFCATVAP